MDYVSVYTLQMSQTIPITYIKVFSYTWGLFIHVLKHQRQTDRRDLH